MTKKYNDFMDDYRLARLSIQMTDAQLVKLHIKKLVENEIKNATTNFQFFYKTGEKDDGMKALMRVELEMIDAETHQAVVEAQVLYEGIFRSKNTIEKDSFEKFVRDQAIPQLLPYCRSILTMVSANLGVKPIELPTMDVIESMMMNQEDTEKKE